MTVQKISVQPSGVHEYAGLSGDTKPSASAIPIGSRFTEIDTGRVYIGANDAWNLLVEKFNSFSQNQIGIDFTAVPRSSSTPQVSSSDQSIQEFGDGTNEMRHLRYTVNAGTLAAAATRLKAGFPDVYMFEPGDFRPIPADVAIVRLDIVAIGDATTGTPAAGALVAQSASEADYQTSIVTFTFGSIDDVRVATIHASKNYSSTALEPTAANLCTVLITGASSA